MVVEMQLVFSLGVVRDRRNLAEDLLQRIILEPVIRLDLALDQVRYVQHLGNTGIGLVVP